jgi:hypothetical protein
MKKIIIFTVIGLLIGMGLGSVVTIAYLGHKLAKSMFMLQEVELIRSESDAIEAYLNEPPEIGIWAFENFINAMNRVIKERRETAGEEYFFLIVNHKDTLKYAHVRLALLYGKAGNDLKRKENLEKAFEYCDSVKIEEELLEERLIKAVTKLDSEYKSLDEE